MLTSREEGRPLVYTLSNGNSITVTTRTYSGETKHCSISSKPVRGTAFLDFSLTLAKYLNFETAELTDVSSNACKNNNTLYSLSLYRFMCGDKTFYEKAGFEFSRKAMKERYSKIRDYPSASLVLLNLLYEVKGSETVPRDFLDIQKGKTIGELWCWLDKNGHCDLIPLLWYIIQNDRDPLFIWTRKVTVPELSGVNKLLLE